MIRNCKIFFSAAFVAALLSVSNAQANHVDFIVDGNFFLATASGGGPATGTQVGAGGNILGTERNVEIDVISGVGFVTASPLGATDGVGVVGPDENTQLFLSNSVSVLGSFELTYDGLEDANGVSPGLGGINFTANSEGPDPYNALVVDFAAVDGQGELLLQLSDSSGNFDTQAITVDSAGDVAFFYDTFVGVDATEIDSVQFTLNTTSAGSDFAISQITRETVVAVPEPGTGLACVLGCVGLISARRRRRS